MDVEKQIDKVFLHSQRMKRVHFWDLISGMTAAEYALLTFMWKSDKDSMTVSELRDGLNMHPTAVSRLLNGLEKSGCIDRCSRKGNRRVTDVFITEQGKESYMKNRKIIHDYWGEVFAGLSEKDTESMFHVWDELINQMEIVLESKTK